MSTTATRLTPLARETKPDSIGDDPLFHVHRLSAAAVRSLGIERLHTSIPFSKYLDGIITQTTLAHRLLLKAWKLGGQAKQQALLTALFKGYFECLINIGDTDALADAAVTAKLMSREEVRVLLSGCN